MFQKMVPSASIRYRKEIQVFPSHRAEKDCSEGPRPLRILGNADTRFCPSWMEAVEGCWGLLEPSTKLHQLTVDSLGRWNQVRTFCDRFDITAA